MVNKPRKIKDREKLFEGSSKIIYYDNDNHEIIQFFKDDIRKDHNTLISILGKGVINNNISATIMSHLNMVGINNHFIQKLNMREQMIEFVDAIPLKVQLSNIASGRYISSLGFEPGYVFPKPMLEWYLKPSFQGKESIVNEHQILNLAIVTKEELEAIKGLAIRVNDFLNGLFAGIGLRLIECNLEFGRTYDVYENSVMLIDEISPDNCGLIDFETNKRYDYHGILENPENAMFVYQEVARRLKTT